MLDQELISKELGCVATTFARPLEGKTALITGSARNLGATFAAGLALAGANTAVHFNSDESRTAAEQVATGAAEAGGKSGIFQADLTDVAGISSLFDAVEERYGGIDIVINNAGAMHKAPIAAT